MRNEDMMEVVASSSSFPSRSPVPQAAVETVTASSLRSRAMRASYLDRHVKAVGNGDTIDAESHLDAPAFPQSVRLDGVGRGGHTGSADVF